MSDRKCLISEEMEKKIVIDDSKNSLFTAKHVTANNGRLVLHCFLISNLLVIRVNSVIKNVCQKQVWEATLYSDTAVVAVARSFIDLLQKFELSKKVICRASLLSRYEDKGT